MNPPNNRKGIAPVIATIILVLIVVVAAGGAFTWINDIIQGEMEEADRQRERSVTVRDVQCADGGNTVDYLMVNDGSVNLDSSDVSVFVYNVSNGNLWGSNLNFDMGSSFDAGETMDSITGGGANAPTITGITFQLGDAYEVEFEFTNNDGYTVSTRCEPR